MATRNKAKAKPRRRKAPAKRPATRRKTVARARKPARKTPLKRAAPKAAKGKVVKPKVVKPKALKPQTQAVSERAAPGKRIGVVTHFYGEPSVAIVKLETGSLRIGDTIHFQGHTTDFSQRVDSLQVEHAAVEEVGPDDDFGVRVGQHVREHDVVYKVAS
jgi:putative protease